MRCFWCNKQIGVHDDYEVATVYSPWEEAEVERALHTGTCMEQADVNDAPADGESYLRE